MSPARSQNTKANTQIQSHLYILTKNMWKQVKHTILFIITPKKMKICIVKNIIKHIQVLYVVNYKTLIKEVCC